MLATSIKKLSPLKAARIKENHNKNYIYSEKYDGQRVAIIVKNGNIKSIVNRRGYEQLEKFTHFKKCDFSSDSMILDAELFVSNSKGISRLNLVNKLANRKRAKMYVFDILSLKGEDLRAEPLIKRRKYLDKINMPKGFILAKQYQNAQKLWDKIIDENREGIVAKKLTDYYIAGRSKSWIKLKNLKEKIITFNKAERHDRGVTLETDDGQVRVSCLGEKSQRVLDYLNLYGEVDAEIQYLRQAKSGKLYQPTFKRLIEKRK